MSCGRTCKNGKKCKRSTNGGPCSQHRSPQSPRTPSSDFLDTSPRIAPSILPGYMKGTPPRATTDPLRHYLPLSPMDKLHEEWYGIDWPREDGDDNAFPNEFSFDNSIDSPPYDLGYPGVVAYERPLPKKKGVKK